MLPEEFSNINQSSNQFEKALYELDYGFTHDQLREKLDEVYRKIDEAKEEIESLRKQRNKIHNALYGDQR